MKSVLKRYFQGLSNEPFQSNIAPILKNLYHCYFKMNPLSSELPFHVRNWLIISLKDFCIVIRKWPTFLPSSCNTFIRKGCNRFKILLRFQIFCIKSNENMVWACHLPKCWECHTIFGRKFLEIYVVIRLNTPLKFVSTRFRVRLYFVNEKINKIF